MDDIERQLLEAGRPEPGADVRARVLAKTLPLVRSDDSRLDRIWFSRTWRMAAVLAVLVLAGADAVSRYTAPWAPAAQDRMASDTVRAVETAAREAGLPPSDAAALVAQAIAAASASARNSMTGDRSVAQAAPGSSARKP